jgi:hypothetical protein
MKKKILGLLLILFLTSCGMNQDVWVYTDDSWKIKQIFDYSPDLIPDLSVGFEGIGLDIPLGGWTDEVIKMSLNQLVQVYKQNGIQAGLKRTRTFDEVNYVINLSGHGLPQLANIGLAGDMKALLEPLASMYQINPPELQQMVETQQLQQMRTVSINRVDENTLHLVIQQPQPSIGLQFKLHAKSILNSNATTVSRSVAEWQDPMVIDVTFQPLPLFNPTPLLIGGGVLAGLGLTVGAIALAMHAVRSGSAHHGISSRTGSAVDRLRRQQQQRRASFRKPGRR